MGDVAQILGIQPNQHAYGMTHSRSGSSQPAAAATATTAATNAAATASSSVLSSHTPFTQPVLRMVASVKSSAEESSAPLPPMAPSLVRVNQKYISTKKKARPWCWAPFASEARNDGLLLHHWVRAGVEYPEYPFARFNIHLDALDYRRGEEDEDGEDGNEFYKEFLQDDHWTKSETDALLDLCRIYELRWPVIIDRWIGKYGSLSNKKVEDLQHRYYTIGMILNRKLVEKAAKLEAENMAKALAASQSSRAGVVGSGGGILSSGTVVGNVSAGMGAIQGSIGEVMSNKNDPETDLRIQHAVISEIATSSSTAISSMIGNVNASMQPPIQATNTGTSNQPPFDLEAERQRRRVLEKIWNRSKEEEMEEESLRAELKLVEAQIRKLKKSGGHILAAAAGGVVPGSTGPTPASSRGPSPVPGSVSAAGTVGAGGGAGVGGASIAGGGVDASFALLDAQFAATAPVPTPGIPYLQSGRLVNPATGGQMSISKASLKRMEQILKELKLNDRPLPTKRVCDMYDHVRKGALTLLTLQKAMLKKESEVMTRRKKLEKIAGAAVAREIQIKAEAAKAAAAAAAEKERIAAEKAKAKEKAKEVASRKHQVAPKKTATKKRPPAKKGTKQKPASKKSNTPKSTPGDAATTPSANTNVKASAAKSSTSKTSTSKASNAKATTAKTSTAKNSTSKTSSAKSSTAKAVMPVPPNLTPPSTAPPSNDNDDMANPKKRAKIS